MVTPFICLWGRYYLPHPCLSFMELGGSLTNSAGTPTNRSDNSLDSTEGILLKKDLYVYDV